jgi:redox-sensitive bicupin YhaK (pirin superfamily)
VVNRPASRLVVYARLKTQIINVCLPPMNNFRSIEKVISPPAPHMVGDGFRVHHFLPFNDDSTLARMSPFFLLDYNSKFEFTSSDHPRGVGVHPHRGFETVTIAFKGKIAHHDSAGNEGIIGEGDIQWMTAASGVLHKEFHEKEFSKKGGLFHMVQLWINLPSKYKMSAPRYQEITSDKKGIVQLQTGRVEIIAGEYKNVNGPALTFSPIELYIIKLEQGDVFEKELPQEYNVCALMVEGSAVYDGSVSIPEDHLMLLKNDGTNIKLETKSSCTILFMAGKPLHEPIAAYGPFLMNTEEEIRQAFEDFRNGKFGYLEE